MVAGVLALDAKAGRAADVAQVEAGGKVGPAEENVDRPDLGRAGARRTVGGDEDVVIAVTVHVAGRADSVAGVAFGGDTVDGDTVSAIQIGQTELGCEGSAAEDDVGAAGIQLAAYGGVGRADDDVAEAVAVQVAGKADGRANPFFFGHAVDAKAVAAVERVEVDSRWEACRAEDNVDCARPRHAAGVAAGCADEQIGQTVAVHVATADGRAGGGIERRAGQAKAVVAVDDSYTTPAGQTLTVAAPGVLGNDVNPRPGEMTAVLAASPAHGTLTLNDNGSFAYTPQAGYQGMDRFTYRADNEQRSDVATVTITITGGVGRRVVLPVVIAP